MPRSRRSKARLPFAQLLSVSVFLCPVAFLTLTQLAVLRSAESAAWEWPWQEAAQSVQGERAVLSSARRHLDDGRHRAPDRPHATGNRLDRLASCPARILSIVGHQLANGLGAPWLI